MGSNSIAPIVLTCWWLLVEVKAVDRLTPLHEAQLLTYLRLGGWKVADKLIAGWLLIDFNVPLLRDGILRRVPGLDEH